MKKLCVLLTVLLLISNVFVHSNHAYAQDLTQQIIKDIKVEKSDGSTGEFTHRERAKISVEFGGAKVSPGDTINISLPEELKGFNKTFELKNEQGVTLGTCEVTVDGIKCTFNDNVKNIDNVRGSFFFEAEINKSTEGKNNVDLNFGNTTIHKEIIVSNSTGSSGESDEIFFKNGQIEPNDTDHVQWTIRFNNKQDYFSPNNPAIIKDTLGPGQKLEADKFQFSVRTKGQNEAQYYTKEEFESRGLGHVEISGNGFTVWFNNPTYNELLIYYSTEITDSNAASFDNNSSVTYIDKSGNQMSENSNATIQNINAGGKAEGDLQKYSGDLIISKIGIDSKGDTKQLEGAEFELVNIDGEVVGKGTTDANGKLIFKDIKGGTHKLKEIKVPDGYKIDKANFPNDIVLDFEVNKEINLEVTNVADTPPEEPTTEEPTTEEPTTEEPTTEEPTTEEPTTEEPTTEEPTTEEPTTEEPTTEEPTTEEPTTEEPTTEEPTTEEPTTEESTTEEPTTEEPTTGKPTTEGSTSGKSKPEDSTMKEQNKNEKNKENKQGVLPNTGEAIQNHPIVTTFIIMILMVLGIVLVSFRRKN
ncbi:LPXTG cell wall anchor domain-containing protein [Mammaliicoccus sp. O-M53]|uniref:LPXTG cell wall anchor domain-containing protein n=1 Tax=Mammaliicoccus sp. O-M53 TaxID=2898712 RepID=UPI001EFAD769|nr:LPXTG cell wall anchor domain-containing protein [Mammaliicoccus sp. O-M53]